MIRVILTPGLPGGPWAALRELCGHDEASVRAADNAAAVAVLDGLLVDQPGSCITSGRAAELAVSDRERLLAALYRETFGDEIESTPRCDVCGKRFELRFSLSALITHARPESTLRIEGPDDECAYTLTHERVGRLRFRLPCFLDEQALVGLDDARASEIIADRCVLDASGAVHHELLASAMEQVGPLTRAELEATCAECGHERPIEFRLQEFVLTALRREGEWLTREVHRIAVSYRWSLSEILGLTRLQRKMYLNHIDREPRDRRWGT